MRPNWSGSSDAASLSSFTRVISLRRAFGEEAYDALHPLAKGTLVSLVYNRGASMVGDSRPSQLR